MDVEPLPSPSTRLQIENARQLDHYLAELALPPSLLKSLTWLYQKERSPKSPIKTQKFWEIYSNPRFHMFPALIKDNLHHELESVAKGFYNAIQLLQKTNSLHFDEDRLHMVDVIAATITVRSTHSDNKAARFIGSCMRGNQKKLSEIAKDTDFKKHFTMAMEAACKQPLSHDTEDIVEKYLSLSNLLRDDQKSLLETTFSEFKNSSALYSKYLGCTKELYQKALLGVETFRNFLTQPKSSFKLPANQTMKEADPPSTSDTIPKLQSTIPKAQHHAPFHKVAEKITRNTPGGRVILGDAIYKVGNGYVYLPNTNQLVKLNPEFLYLKSHTCGKFHYFDYSFEFNRHSMPTDLPIELHNPYRLESYSYVIVDNAIRMLGRGYYFCNGKLLSLVEEGITGIYVSTRT
ncbi:MAG: hypothetical protein HQM14_01010 [SAR324 cluster bacterium]|nr:hypothetical protein [SAR324 cluster bacterium]